MFKLDVEEIDIPSLTAMLVEVRSYLSGLMGLSMMIERICLALPTSFQPRDRTEEFEVLVQHIPLLGQRIRDTCSRGTFPVGNHAV
jgi:hypothetical protein